LSHDSTEGAVLAFLPFIGITCDFSLSRSGSSPARLTSAYAFHINQLATPFIMLAHELFILGAPLARILSQQTSEAF
jgi:hypothetical protein